MIPQRFIQPALLAAFGFLLALGLLMVFSSSAALADIKYNDSFYFLKRQILFAVVAVLAAYACTYIPSHLYQKYYLAIYGFGILFLLLVLVPGVGKSAGGAARWMSLGPFRLQGGELFKIALCVFLASSLANKAREMHTFRVGLVLQLLFPGVAMALLLLEPDFGTTFLVATLTFVVLFIGGARIAYLLGVIILALPLAYYAIASSPYRMERVKAFLDPWSHRHESGYQVTESLISFGSGEAFGLGLGNGTAKLFFLPAAHTDFILAVIGEELGFMGVMLVLLAFLTIGLAGLSVALKAKERQNMLLAAGVTAMILLQAIFNFFVVTGLAPTKGVTLPLVSYGGSSLLTSAIMIGILLRLNQEAGKT
jgi:cell division protein FtsW